MPDGDEQRPREKRDHDRERCQVSHQCLQRAQVVRIDAAETLVRLDHERQQQRRDRRLDHDVGQQRAPARPGPQLGAGRDVRNDRSLAPRPVADPEQN